jgi:hypothetical protein
VVLHIQFSFFLIIINIKTICFSVTEFCQIRPSDSLGFYRIRLSDFDLDILPQDVVVTFVDVSPMGNARVYESQKVRGEQFLRLNS